MFKIFNGKKIKKISHSYNLYNWDVKNCHNYTTNNTVTKIGSIKKMYFKIYESTELSFSEVFSENSLKIVRWYLFMGGLYKTVNI